jgi:HK97 family phage prohead protease
MPVDSELHVRSFEVSLRETDKPNGMTGLAIPYGRETPITELVNGRLVNYREIITRGTFERATRAPWRVPLMYEHGDTFDQRLGYAEAVRETDAGLEIDFRLDPSRADHARDVLLSSHASLSAAFRSIIPKPGSERDGDLVVRRSAILVHVAAVPEPAYPDARVLAVREAADDAPTAAELEHERHRLDLVEFQAWLATAKDDQSRYDALK